MRRISQGAFKMFKLKQPLGYYEPPFQTFEEEEEDEEVEKRIKKRIHDGIQDVGTDEETCLFVDYLCGKVSYDYVHDLIEREVRKEVRYELNREREDRYL